MAGEWKKHYLKSKPTEEQISFGAKQILRWMQARSRRGDFVTKSGVASSVVEEFLTSHRSLRKDSWALRLGVERLVERKVLLQKRWPRGANGGLYLAPAYSRRKKPQPAPVERNRQRPRRLPVTLPMS